jgi:hypothetical protein
VNSDPKKCSVPGCDREASFDVFLYDFYPWGEVFDKQDFTCPHICATHAVQNEAGAKGERKPRGMVEYPFTNKDYAQGFTI